MKHKIGLKLVLAVLSLSLMTFAQSGASRGGNNAAKKNRPAQTAPVEQKQSETQPSTDARETGVIADDEVLKVDTNLITVPVSVYDRAGRFVPDLTRADFQIFENDQLQQIEFFARTETPYTVALVLDTSLSAKFKIDDIQTAAFQFVMGLRPDDKVLVISFDEQVRFLNEPTSDRETLRLAVRKTRFGGGTSLYEAMQATFTRMAKTPGRKAVVLFTDGVDTTSRDASYKDTLAQAQELDALVYTVYYDTYQDVQNQINDPSILNPTQVPGAPVPLPQTRPTIPGTSIPLPQLPNRRRNYPNDPNANRYPNDPNSNRYPNDPRRDPNDPTYPNDPNYPSRNPGGVITTGGGTSAEYQRGREYLEKLSTVSGGRFYTADSRGGLSSAFDQINGELRRQYSIGYYPTSEGKLGDVRRLKVKVNRDKTSVRARDSYIVGKTSENGKGDKGQN